MSYKKAANAWLKCAGQAEPRRARGAIASACGGLGIAQSGGGVEDATGISP
jgi:hypothetical protein